MTSKLFVDLESRSPSPNMTYNSILADLTHRLKPAKLNPTDQSVYDFAEKSKAIDILYPLKACFRTLLLIATKVMENVLNF